MLCLAGVSTQVNAEPPRDAGRFVIDIEAKSIATVRVPDSVPELRKRFGASNVVEASEDLEGDPSPIVVIAVDGHKLVKHWNHMSTDDPTFKTKEALGPGSALTAFEQAYGPASRGEGEGGWYVNFGTGTNAEFQVRVGNACFGEQLRLKRDSKCIVKEILL
jgi:hypothetical protein